MESNDSISDEEITTIVKKTINRHKHVFERLDEL